MSKRSPSLTRMEQVSILLEEYRALYALASFRLGALEHRVPVAAGATVALLASLLSLPAEARLVVLIALPIGVLWFVRTTINHARSFEDALRRIDAIEQHINRLAGETLLAFQSRHPSRGFTVGGRTGRETIRSVIAAGAAVLIGAGVLAHSLSLVSPSLDILFSGFYALTLVTLIVEAARLRSYRYRMKKTDETN